MKKIFLTIGIIIILKSFSFAYSSPFDQTVYVTTTTPAYIEQRIKGCTIYGPSTSAVVGTNAVKISSAGITFADGTALATAAPGALLSSTQTFTGQNTFTGLVTVSSGVVINCNGQTEDVAPALQIISFENATKNLFTNAGHFIGDYIDVNNKGTNIWTEDEIGITAGLVSNLHGGGNEDIYDIKSITCTDLTAKYFYGNGGNVSNVNAVTVGGKSTTTIYNDIATSTTAAVTPYLAKSGGTMTGQLNMSNYELYSSSSVRATTYYGSGVNLTGVTGGVINSIEVINTEPMGDIWNTANASYLNGYFVRGVKAAISSCVYYKIGNDIKNASTADPAGGIITTWQFNSSGALVDVNVLVSSATSDAFDVWNYADGVTLSSFAVAAGSTRTVYTP